MVPDVKQLEFPMTRLMTAAFALLVLLSAAVRADEPAKDDMKGMDMKHKGMDMKQKHEGMGMMGDKGQKEHMKHKKADEKDKADEKGARPADTMPAK
jgi:hypothetical protein